MTLKLKYLLVSSLAASLALCLIVLHLVITAILNGGMVTIQVNHYGWWEWALIDLGSLSLFLLIGITSLYLVSKTKTREDIEYENRRREVERSISGV